jgi:MATE family multidrug resistance protein
MSAAPHPFTTHPHKTLVSLSIPVLISLTAEPITALVDTAFISSLGVVPLAALGVGATALSSLFWIFNFLGVSTQTEVAQLDGKGQQQRAREILSLSLMLSGGFGLALILFILPTSSWIAHLLGASGSVQASAVSYMRTRLFGAPAVLLLLAVFGALRGLQDMKSPLWIALGLNLVNILLDWLLIFGQGPIPSLGIRGSALASTISQWLGALAGLVVIGKRIGITLHPDLSEAGKILRVGRDMFIRTGILNLYLAYTTRVANGLGPDAGAAHQVIRQMWVFTALAMDAVAFTLQSLVGYFIGSGSVAQAKKAVGTALVWSLGTGLALLGLMWWGRDPVASIMVPMTALGVFVPAWKVFSLSQPLNSLAFLTDGVHWGTGDFAYLRDVMLLASLSGIAGLYLLEHLGTSSLQLVWTLTAGWMSLRAVFGLLRIWPGIGKSPFRERQ